MTKTNKKYITYSIDSLKDLIEVDKYIKEGEEVIGVSSQMLSDMTITFYNRMQGSKNYLDRMEEQLHNIIDDENNPNIDRFCNIVDVAQKSYAVWSDLFNWWNDEVYTVINGTPITEQAMEKMLANMKARIAGQNKSKPTEEQVKKAKALLKKNK